MQRFQTLSRPRLLLIAAIVLGFVYLLFFHSHSLYGRWTWEAELNELQQENTAMQERIEVLRGRIDDGISDEAIERIAREQYGMRRPGETVYPTKPPTDD